MALSKFDKNYLKGVIYRRAMTTEIILKKLDEIKSELDFIKQRLVDTDTILTEDDLQSIRDAERDAKLGRTKRLI